MTFVRFQVDTNNASWLVVDNGVPGRKLKYDNCRTTTQ